MARTNFIGGIQVTDDSDNLITAVDATGNLYQANTKVTTTAANLNKMTSGMYDPTRSSPVKVLFRTAATFGNTARGYTAGAAYVEYRQATILNVLSTSVHVVGTSASGMLGGYRSQTFTWREVNASSTGAGSTLRVYGWRAATPGLKAATPGANSADVKLEMVMMGT